ncbi:helix-turn-helix transcriptional regulator [Oxalobacteraceae bacterium R-40]|uniref:Helix-turn-helix transcriptional regulator n=1 Tax=Keguizhuia sedimenti TaxID=3064264 RepID=A0ABU1BUS9_9BURK|nr:helix-turn-helix transcriptional regulator [Oxalobacteraceae bacterium R-40]
MSEVNVAFGALLSRLRKNAQLTQEELAGKISLSRSALANIERGNQGVTLVLIFAMAKALNLSPVDLIPAIESLEEKVKSVVINERDQEILMGLVSAEASIKGDE